MKVITKTLSAIALSATLSTALAATAVAAPTDKSILLVHGGFVDGSGWEGVYDILKKDGYDVTIVQNPTISLAGDVAVTRQAIAQATKPVILVGHSYGGVVVSEAGTDPKVASVVYITAFAPVTARRSPAWNELLAPEGDTAVAAISGFNANFGFINEHRFEPWAVSASRSALTRPASSLLRIWRNQPDFIRL